MAGCPSVHLPTVHVAPAFLLTMLFHAQRVDSLQYDTMKVRDLTAELLSEVCHAVEIEPHLQPLNDETFQQKIANV